MQEAAFLHRAPALTAKPREHVLTTDGAANLAILRWAGSVAGGGCGEVGDVFWKGVLGADRGDANVGGFAGFAEGVVARVEVFTFLKLVLEQVLLVWQFAVKTEEALFVCTQGADIDLVALMRIQSHLEVLFVGFKY